MLKKNASGGNPKKRRQGDPKIEGGFLAEAELLCWKKSVGEGIQKSVGKGLQKSVGKGLPKLRMCFWQRREVLRRKKIRRDGSTWGDVRGEEGGGEEGRGEGEKGRASRWL